MPLTHVPAYIAKPTLLKIYAWAEENEGGDPLAHLYFQGCIAVKAAMDYEKQREATRWKTRVDTPEWKDAVRELEDAEEITRRAIAYRDAVGRKILKTMKATA